MTRPWVAGFLTALRGCGVVAQAARAAGISYGTAYAARREDGDFAAAWDEALEESYDALEAEALRRATHGHEEPLTYQGNFTYVKDPETGVIARDPDGNPIVQTIRKPSDALLQFVLKGRRKKVYAERTELTGADGAPLQAMDETARAARVAALLRTAAERMTDDCGGII